MPSRVPTRSSRRPAARSNAKTIDGPDYLQSINIVHATGRQIAQFFENHDMLITATLAEPPARVGRFAMSNPDFLDYRLGPKGIIHYSPFTSIFNITGQPAASLPLHWSKEGLPVGVHFAARFGDEATLLKLATQLEQAQPWFGKRPVLTGSDRTQSPFRSAAHGLAATGAAPYEGAGSVRVGAYAIVCAVRNSLQNSAKAMAMRRGRASLRRIRPS